MIACRACGRQKGLLESHWHQCTRGDCAAVLCQAHSGINSWWRLLFAFWFSLHSKSVDRRRENLYGGCPRCGSTLRRIPDLWT